MGSLSGEVVEGEEYKVEVKIAGNTFQLKTRVRTEEPNSTSRMWRERRLSDRRTKSEVKIISCIFITILIAKQVCY